MKIKFFTSNAPESLEKAVNNFIETKKIISINFSVGAFPTYAEFYAMVLYEN
jgi:hypothetical protein